MRGFNTKESKLAEVVYICLGKSKRCTGGLKCPTSHDWPSEDIDWTATEYETWRKYRCTRICKLCRRESRTVNGWCKNILMTKYTSLWDYLLVTNVSKGFAGFPMLFQARSLIYSKTVNALVVNSIVNKDSHFARLSASSMCKMSIGHLSLQHLLRSVIHSVRARRARWSFFCALIHKERHPSMSPPGLQKWLGQQTA